MAIDPPNLMPDRSIDREGEIAKATKEAKRAIEVLRRIARDKDFSGRLAQATLDLLIAEASAPPKKREPWE